MLNTPKSAKIVISEAKHLLSTHRTSEIMSINIQHLTKTYGAQTAVDEISFSIGKGEIVGFLGPNGAGKSTTMKMITGYLMPDAGKVEVCGINVAENPMATKSKIGYLAEANPLYYDVYVREYLSFIAGVHRLRNVKEAVENAIRLTGLTVESNKKAGQLSKGYKQRVGLAAALIHNPEVLILDEPTSGLDPNQIIEIRNVIKEQGINKTVLFSSHILQEVEAICQRIIIINKGKIVANDVLSNLTKEAVETESHIVLELAETVAAEIFSGLNSAAVMLSGNKWVFTTNNPQQLRNQLMEMVVKHDWNLVSLANESGSNLAEVFRNLTSTK